MKQKAFSTLIDWINFYQNHITSYSAKIRDIKKSYNLDCYYCIFNNFDCLDQCYDRQQNEPLCFYPNKQWQEIHQNVEVDQ